MSYRSRFFNVLTALCLGLAVLVAAGAAQAQSRLLDNVWPALKPLLR